jgi:target of EGR1 protein 1
VLLLIIKQKIVHSSAINVLNWFRYHVQAFNLVVLCGQDYIVEPGSLKFLVEHGFDFQRQYSKGLTYTRGDESVSYYDILLYA